jgi:hypothetical protein
LKRFTANLFNKKSSFLFRQKSKESPPTERPLQESTAALSRSASRSSTFGGASPVRRGSTPSGVTGPRPMSTPQDEEAVTLYKRFLYHLHTHLRRFCIAASKEQCHDWANDYHNCQFLQSSDVFRLMNNVRTSPATVIATAAAVDPTTTVGAAAGGGGGLRLTKGNLKAAFEGPPEGMKNFPGISGARTPLEDTLSIDSLGEELENEKVGRLSRPSIARWPFAACDDGYDCVYVCVRVCKCVNRGTSAAAVVVL